MTRDEDFIIDAVPGWPEVTLAAGFSGHGFKFGSVLGRLLSDLVTTGSTSYDLSAFSIHRPAVGLSAVEGAAAKAVAEVP
jgi:N-methyl-L-tryptophan oxidase